MDLFVGQGTMFDAARHDDKFAFADCFGAITELHLERALGDQKEFVFLVMMMPHEFTFEFNGLHVAIVDFSEDARAGQVGKEREFVAQIYRGVFGGVHGRSSRLCTSLVTELRASRVVSLREVSEYTRRRF